MSIMKIVPAVQWMAKISCTARTSARWGDANNKKAFEDLVKFELKFDNGLKYVIHLTLKVLCFRRSTVHCSTHVIRCAVFNLNVGVYHDGSLNASV